MTAPRDRRVPLDDELELGVPVAGADEPRYGRRSSEAPGLGRPLAAPERADRQSSDDGRRGVQSEESEAAARLAGA